MNFKFVKSGVKKRLIGELDEMFGISKLDFLLLETGKQKIRGFSGSMTRDEIREISGIANVEIVGSYLFKKEAGGIRLSLDGCFALKDWIDKSVLEISNEQVGLWMKGENIGIQDLTNPPSYKGIFIVKNGGDFFGCGIFNGEEIVNCVPKERRVRKG